MRNDRYIRQTILENFGEAGQMALKNSAVLIVGAGGLGVSIAQYLNAMGIGKLGIMDGDTIEHSNLHRQPAYTPVTVGQKKTTVLGNWLRAQNPETNVFLYDCYLRADNALEILISYQLIIDATDNLNTRYLIDDACLLVGLPWIYGALHGFEGQVSVFNFNNGPTYRCLFPNKPLPGEIPDCNTQGTLGVLPGIIGNLQALEAVKLISGLPGVLTGTILLYNALRQEFRHLKIQRSADRKANLDRLNGMEYLFNSDLEGIRIEAYLRIEKLMPTQILIDVREPEEFLDFNIPNSINIPLQKIHSQLKQLSSFNQIFVICKSGGRSKQACEILKNVFSETSVKWIIGGVSEFKNLKF